MAREKGGGEGSGQRARVWGGLGGGVGRGRSGVGWARGTARATTTTPGGEGRRAGVARVSGGRAVDEWLGREAGKMKGGSGRFSERNGRLLAEAEALLVGLEGGGL